MLFNIEYWSLFIERDWRNSYLNWLPTEKEIIDSLHELIKKIVLNHNMGLVRDRFETVDLIKVCDYLIMKYYMFYHANDIINKYDYELAKYRSLYEGCGGYHYDN